MTAHTINHGYADITNIAREIKVAYKKYFDVAPYVNVWDCPTPAEKSIRTRRFNILYRLCETNGLNVNNTLAALASADPKEWD
jgi:hypothetical protein